MPHAFRRVPGPLEVDILQAEIGREQGFMTTRNGNHPAVVPNSNKPPEAGARSSCGSLTNTSDEGFLRHRHGAINIQGINVGASVTMAPTSRSPERENEFRVGTRYPPSQSHHRV